MFLRRGTVLALVAAVIGCAGVTTAAAAPGDDAEAIAQLVDADLLGRDLADAVTASAGYPSDPGPDAAPVSASVLGGGLAQISIGGVTLPLVGDGGGAALLDLGEAAGAGALNGYGSTPTGYQAAAASGAVGDDGAVDLSPLDDPADTDYARLDLTAFLGQLGVAGLTSQIVDGLSLGLGAFASSAQQTAGSDPDADYVLSGAELSISSPLVEGLVESLDTAIAGLDGDLDALLAEDGTAQDALDALALDPVDVAGAVSVDLGTPTIAADVDLSGVTAGLLGTPLVSPDGLVTIDLATGVVTVDLARLRTGGLNDLPANTPLLTGPEIDRITDTVTGLLTGLSTTVAEAIDTAIDTTAVTITFDPEVTALAGVLSGDLAVVVDTTLGDLAAGTTAADDVAVTGDLAVAGLPIDLVDAVGEIVVPLVVDQVLPALTAPVEAVVTTTVAAETADGVVDGVVAGLDPLLSQVIARAVVITVNSQTPVPPVPGSPFTVRALVVQVLPASVDTVALGLAASTVRTLAALPGAPTVTGLTPPSGPTRGGTTVTITGTGLDAVTAVTFGGTPGTGIVRNQAGTSLTVVTPVSETGGPVDVALVSPAGSTTAPAAYAYVAPTLVDVQPAQGPEAGGTAVTLTGSGLTGATGVTFGTTAATDVVVVDDGTITATVPAGTGLVDVTVALPGADAALADAYAYLAPGAPAVTTLDPDSGPTSGGTTVTITGTGLAGTTAVTFDGAPAEILDNPDDTTLVVRTPAGAAGPADVAITNGDGLTGILPRGFTYVPDGSDATVTDLTPDQVSTAGGTVVTIVGDGFTGATGVLFDGVPGTGVTVSPDGTTITVTAPASETAGPADVTIVFPAGQAAAGTVAYVAPAVTAVDPASGPTTGGTSVTITGTDLGQVQQVLFDGVAGTGLTVAPDGTSLTVTTPPGYVGGADVRLVLPGLDVTVPDGFTYLAAGAAPVVDDVTPGSGSTAGGTTVVVDGSGFVPGRTLVQICGVTRDASQVSVNAAGTRLSFVTPACAAGTRTLSVITPDGTATATFRYVDPSLALTGPAGAAGLAVLAGLLLAGGFLGLRLRRTLALVRA